MVNTRIEQYRGQDFIIHEEDYRTTRIEGVLTNDTGAAAAFPGGLLLVGAAPAFTPHTNDAGVTTVTGILVHQSDEIAAAGTQKVAVLVTGPAVIDLGAVADVAGAAADAGAIADIGDLGIKAQAAPAYIEEGSPTIPAS